MLAAPPASAAGEPPPRTFGDALGGSTFEAGVPEEVVSLRTGNSRTFIEPDGTQTAHVYPGRVNYRDAEGLWQPIDNSLRRASRAGYGFENTSNAYTLLLPEALDAAPVRFEMGGRWIEFSLVGAGGRAAVSGSKASFGDALPGVSVAYEAGNEVVKETLTLASVAAPNAFAFRLRTSEGLTPKLNPEGGIDFLTQDGKARFGLAPPVMWDSSGTDEGVSNAVAFNLEPLAADGFILSLTADQKWLTDPKRVWPVVIDPTITSSDAQDCHLAQNGATTSYCSTSYLRVGLNAGYKRRALLKFDIWNIPSGVALDYATLRMNCTRATTTATSDYVVRRVTRAWTNAATWNKYDGVNNWTSAGGDADATNWGTRSLNCSTLGWKDWGVTSLVQNWVNGTWPNHGLMLRQSGETVDNLLDFASLEDTARAPYLEVRYNRAPSGVTNLSPASGTGWKNLTPTLSGVYSDPDGDTGRIWYEVYRSSDGYRVASGWGAYASSGQTSSWTLPSGVLTFGTQYHWYAIAQDWPAAAYGPWSAATYYATSPNARPTMASPTPSSGTISLNTTPQLAAVYSDADGEAGKMYFQVFDPTATHPDFPIASGWGTQVAPGGTSTWQVPSGILGSPARYEWAAVPFDGYEYGNWSEQLVYIANHTPSVPSLAEPADGMRVAFASQQLRATTSDADGGTPEIIYQVATSMDFGAGTCSSGWVPSGSTVDARAFCTIQSGGTYWWRARARDAFEETASSAARMFVVNKPPGVPAELTPVSGTVAYDSTPTLSARYTDPDGDAGRIRFIIDRGDGQPLTGQAGEGTTVASGSVSSWEVPSELLTPGVTYLWYAVASDGLDERFQTDEDSAYHLEPGPDQGVITFTQPKAVEDAIAWARSRNVEPLDLRATFESSVSVDDVVNLAYSLDPRTEIGNGGDLFLASSLESTETGATATQIASSAATTLSSEMADSRQDYVDAGATQQELAHYDSVTAQVESGETLVAALTVGGTTTAIAALASDPDVASVAVRSQAGEASTSEVGDGGCADPYWPATMSLWGRAKTENGYSKRSLRLSLRWNTANLDRLKACYPARLTYEPDVRLRKDQRGRTWIGTTNEYHGVSTMPNDYLDTRRSDRWTDGKFVDYTMGTWKARRLNANKTYLTVVWTQIKTNCTPAWACDLGRNNTSSGGEVRGQPGYLSEDKGPWCSDFRPIRECVFSIETDYLFAATVPGYKFWDGPPESRSPTP